MIRWILLSIFIAVLSACDQSGHNFGYLPVLQGREGGAEYDLGIGTNVAKTIQNNFEWHPSFEDVAHRPAALTARLSGCEVRWVTRRCKSLGCLATEHHRQKSQT